MQHLMSVTALLIILSAASETYHVTFYGLKIVFPAFKD